MEITDNQGRKTRVEYDLLNREIRRTEKDGGVTRSFYDGNGNRTHKHQLGGDTLYHYDPLNQVKMVEYPGYTEELFYDKAGNRTHIKSSGGAEQELEYDARGNIVGVVDGNRNSTKENWKMGKPGDILTLRPNETIIKAIKGDCWGGLWRTS